MSRKPVVIAAMTTLLAAVPENPQDAFRQVVYSFGVKELASQLLMNEGTLHNKCNADEDSHHKPTLRDVVNVTRATGDTRILESLDRMFGRAGYEVAPGAVCDTALLELLCKVGSEQGAMHQAVLVGLQDDRFTSTEMRAVRAEAFDVINAVLNFVQRMEGLVDD